MGQQYPSTYGVEDWVKSIKGMGITAYMEPKLGQDESFSKSNFEKAIKKVNQKHNMPIGEHIREAVRVMKGKEG